MVIVEQLENLYLKMPGTEPVTVTNKRGVNHDITETQSVSHAWQRAISRDDVAKGLVTSSVESIVWNIPDILLVGKKIETGDTITDSNSVVWTVLSIDQVRLRTHWRCICRREK